MTDVLIKTEKNTTLLINYTSKKIKIKLERNLDTEADTHRENIM